MPSALRAAPQVRPQPPARRAVPTGGGALDLHRRVGNAAFAQLAAQRETKADDAAAKQKAAKEEWTSLLGEKIGGGLFKLIVDNLSPDDLASYAGKGFAAAVEQTAKVPGVDAGAFHVDAKANQAAAKAGADWLSKVATDFLKTEKGQKMLTAVSGFVQEHPVVVLTSALAIAIGAAIAVVAANLDPPAFEKVFDIGKTGLKAGGGIDIGKLQELTIQGAKLSFGYSAKGVEALLSGSYKKSEKEGEADKVTVDATYKAGDQLSFGAQGVFGTSGNAFQGASGSFNLGQKPRLLTGKLSVNPDGDLTVDTGGQFSLGSYGVLSGNLSHSEGDKGATVGKISLLQGNDEANVTTDASFDFTKGYLTVGRSGFQKFQGGQFKFSETNDPEKGSAFEGSFDYKRDLLKLHLDGAMKNGSELTKANASAEVGDESFTAGAGVGHGEQGTTVSGLVKGKEGDFNFNMAGTYNLDQQTFSKLAVDFGYDPPGFGKYLFNYAHTLDGKVSSDVLRLAMEGELKRWAFRLEGSADIKGGELSKGMGTGVVGYNTGWHGLALLGGTRLYGGTEKQGWDVGVGAQTDFIPVPVMVWVTTPTMGNSTNVMVGVDLAPLFRKDDKKK